MALHTKRSLYATLLMLIVLNTLKYFLFLFYIIESFSKMLISLFVLLNMNGFHKQNKDLS